MNGETFRATVIASLNAGTTAVVFDFGYMDQSGGATHLDTQTAAGDFQTLVQAALAAVLPSTLTFNRYRFACVGGTHVGEIGYVEVDPPVNGGLAVVAGVLPNEICISLKRRTGYSTPHDRGRIFLGPVASDLWSTSPNKPDRTFADLITARDLLALPLTTQAVELAPVILKADGTSEGRMITHVAIGEVYTHRKSRRPRSLV